MTAPTGLAEQLKIPRSPIRQALRLLADESVVAAADGAATPSPSPVRP
ncbi:hypothetical protein AB0L35_35330 [Streptomyces sp. NPDC052309]